MKKTFLLFALLILAYGILTAQTTVNFDDAAKWTAGSVSITSYASDHTYVDGVFSATGGPALRNTTALQDGFPGALGVYAWRLQNLATTDWRITIASGGVSTFSMDIRRWDSSPSPDYNLEYSTDGGSSWTLVTIINNASLNESSNWVTFNGTINSTNDNILIRLLANSAGERIHVDNFVWTGYTGGANVPPSISNIVQTPSTDIINTTTVSVSATITDSDGAVDVAQLRWGTTSGTYGNTIEMDVTSGDTYTTVSDIPAQTTGTTVYYVIDATDDDSDTTTSPEQSYEVVAPATTTIPYSETFDADLGDCYAYSVSGDTKYWNWSSSNYAYMNGYNSGDTEEDWLILPGMDFSAYGDLQMSFDTWYNYGSDDANNYLKLMYSADYAGLGDPSNATWNELVYTQPSATQTWTSSGLIDLSGVTGSSVWIGFKYRYESGSYRSWQIDNLLVDEAPEDPVIYNNPATLSGFTYEYLLGPSTEQSFTVSGTNLTADISITAPTNYEISTTTGVNFGSSLTLTASKLDVTETTIYVRLKAGLAIGTYNGEDITITSTGATSQTVTCGGEVTSPPPPEEPVAGEATGVGENSFTATWSPVTGATGYYLDVYTMEEGGTATDLIISEYIEGSSSNKYIEIYNGTGSSIDLSNYYLQLYSNGSATSTASVQLSGSLANGETAVYQNSSAALTLPSGVTATNNSAVNFNGDDAVALYYDDGTKAAYYVDIFGVIGDDPGSAWTGDGGYTTVNKTLVRKSTVTSGINVNPSGTGSSAFTTLVSEWDMYDQDTASYLGSHTFGGGSATYVTGYEDLDVGNLTSYPVIGLEPGTTYYYVVRAYNDYGTSGDSEPAGVTTDEEPLPVELASFTATISAENNIALTWVTQTETGMQGYYIHRSASNQISGAQIVSPLIQATNTTQQQSYTFEDTEVYDTGTYYYWLQANDMDGTVGFHGPVSVFYNSTGDNPTPEIPQVTELKSVYPNPFNPTAFIPFSLAQANQVEFKIYNSRGQIVKHFDLGNKAAGNYRIIWDGTDYNGKSLANGVYHIMMTAGTEIYQTKAVLLK